MTDSIEAVVLIVLGLIAGNLLADQATLRDCATKGYAELVGGGVVNCEVMKEVKRVN